MAAINFSFYFADQSSDGLGTGPYVLTVRQNPATPPAGGTLLATYSNTQGNINPPELAALGQTWMSDAIATLNTSDTNN